MSWDPNQAFGWRIISRHGCSDEYKFVAEVRRVDDFENEIVNPNTYRADWPLCDG
jgi:hypothetical protein